MNGLRSIEDLVYWSTLLRTEAFERTKRLKKKKIKCLKEREKRIRKRKKKHVVHYYQKKKKSP